MTVTEILHQVWERSEGGFVFLPYKDTEADQWQEGAAIHLPTMKPMASLQPGKCDMFFTPVQYIAEPRVADNQGQVGVLYADLDADFDQDMLDEIYPTLLWETSPGSFQAIWFLDRAVPGGEALDLNRRLSHLLKADHGSWIPTKVLRVPGSVNWKRGGVKGEITSFDPTIIYPVDRLKEDLPVVPTISASPDLEMPPVPTPGEHKRLLVEVWDKLDHRTKQLLVLDKVPDRSLHLARLAKRMADRKFSPQMIFGVLSRLPSNKFWGRPEVLWRSVVLSALD